VVGPAFSPSQLAFAGTASLVLYGVFVFVQAVRHRDYFLPDAKIGIALDEEAHAPPPSTGVALASLALLLISLVAIVSLAKALTPVVDEGIAALGARTAVVGFSCAHRKSPRSASRKLRACAGVVSARLSRPSTTFSPVIAPIGKSPAFSITCRNMLCADVGLPPTAPAATPLFRGTGQ
jgi:hypothetical protein